MRGCLTSRRCIGCWRTTWQSAKSTAGAPSSRLRSIFSTPSPSGCAHCRAHLPTRTARNLVCQNYRACCRLPYATSHSNGHMECSYRSEGSAGHGLSERPLCDARLLGQVLGPVDGAAAAFHCSGDALPGRLPRHAPRRWVTPVAVEAADTAMSDATRLCRQWQKHVLESGPACAAQCACMRRLARVDTLTDQAEVINAVHLTPQTGQRACLHFASGDKLTLQTVRCRTVLPEPDCRRQLHRGHGPAAVPELLGRAPRHVSAHARRANLWSSQTDAGALSGFQLMSDSRPGGRSSHRGLPPCKGQLHEDTGA